MEAGLGDIHELVNILALYGCLERTNLIFKICALNIIYNLVNSLTELIVISCLRQYLNCYT